MIPIINIRGANGSGKSYLIRSWMKNLQATPYPRRNNLLGGDTLIGRPQYYKLSDGGIVIGSYENDCGGCDTIDTTEAVRAAILRAVKLAPRYVLFEGVIISTVFESWFEFSKKVGGMYWVYLDTPVAVCLKRISKRNNGAEIKEQLVYDKIKSIEATRQKALNAGEKVITLPWKTAVNAFREFMGQFR